MKLHEIKRVRKASNSETISVEPGDGMYGKFDVVVEFDYEGSSHSQHQPDNSSFREYHGGQAGIESIILADEVLEINEDGENTGKSWPAGTDARKLPIWDQTDDKFVQDKIEELITDYDQADNDPRNEHNPDDR